jgi:hypothetical protein
VLIVSTGSRSLLAYAIDDETAIKVVDQSVDVVSEGHWKLLTREGGQMATAQL